MSRHTLLIAGLVLRIAADIVLALSGSVDGVALGVVLWGPHMGLTQGLPATLVTDAAPAELRERTFTGAIFTVLAVIGLLMLRRSRNGGALGGLSDRPSRRYGAPSRR